MTRSPGQRPPSRSSLSWERLVGVATWHVWAALALALLSAIVAAAWAGGNARLVVVVPFLLFAPGHLLVQAAVTRGLRVWPPLREVLFAVGASPVVLALAALSTALLPGGFTQTRIVLATTVLCGAMAAVALTRHVRRGPLSATASAQDP